MDRVPALMTVAKLSAWFLVVAASGTLGLSCKTGPELQPTVERDGSEDGPRRMVPVGDTWFSVRKVPCAQIVAAIATFSQQPGVVGPKKVRVEETGLWCSVVPIERANDRADSLAQNVSSLLAEPAVAFYVSEGRWSYAVYDAGNPVAAMESHYGDDPVVIGDVARASTLLGLGAEVLQSYEARATEPEAHHQLAGSLGVVEPRPTAYVADIAAAVAEATAKTLTIGDPTPADAPDFESGRWVVMPPMGILLIKGVEAREVDGKMSDFYMVIDGPKTIEVPVDEARRLGMRAVAHAERADALLAELEEDVQVAYADEYVETRVRGYLDALTNGRLAEIATAHRELCSIKGERTLYSHEAGMLTNVREWLAEELSIAKNVQHDEIKQTLIKACE